MTIGETLKGLRKKAGLTQHELAVKIGCTSANISQYESGARQPSTKQLKKFADALSVDLTVFTFSRIEAIKNNSMEVDPDIVKSYAESDFGKKLAMIGFTLKNTETGLILVTDKNIEHSITIEQIETLNARCNSYLKFLLSEL